MAGPIPLFYRLLLGKPDRVLFHLDKLHAAGRIDSKPNLWQVSMGIFYMLHRMFFRPETIGVDDAPVRETWRARLLAYRPLRVPVLVWQEALDPFDLTGLVGGIQEKHKHLVGAYHPGENALYDLECMAWNEDALRRLREDVIGILEGKTWRARLLQDLAVYEGYHARLLGLVDRALAGDYEPASEKKEHPDTTLRAFLRWCAAQPETPEATLEALLRGEVHFGPRAA
jgi:hypothetical protein